MDALTAMQNEQPTKLVPYHTYFLPFSFPFPFAYPNTFCIIFCLSRFGFFLFCIPFSFFPFAYFGTSSVNYIPISPSTKLIKARVCLATNPTVLDMLFHNQIAVSWIYSDVL